MWPGSIFPAICWLGPPPPCTIKSRWRRPQVWQPLPVLWASAAGRRRRGNGQPGRHPPPRCQRGARAVPLRDGGQLGPQRAPAQALRPLRHPPAAHLTEPAPAVWGGAGRGRPPRGCGVPGRGWGVVGLMAGGCTLHAPPRGSVQQGCPPHYYWAGCRDPPHTSVCLPCLLARRSHRLTRFPHRCLP